VHPSIIAALITAAATILVAVMGGYFRSRNRSARPSADTSPALAAKTVFVDVAVDPATPYWHEQRPHGSASSLDREARWYISQVEQVEHCDLPLAVTILNRGSGAAVLTRIGVEVVALANAWYTGRYYGEAPRATKIELSGSYELRLPNLMAELGLFERDPDEEGWIEVGRVCERVLEPPMHLEAGAPFHYSLVLEEYDQGMPTHALLRLWANTSSGTASSDEILVSFRR